MKQQLSLTPEMPLLNHVRAEFGALDESIHLLAGLQHLLGSTVSLIRGLAGDRIRPDRVLLLGKPYSTNRSVMRFLRRELGYWVHPRSWEQSVGGENDRTMDRRIHDLLGAVRHRLNAPGGAGRVVLIDDGGRAIRRLHTRRYADIRSRFTCVEQTRCGIRALENVRLEIPVVNVAESRVKLEYESPLIAESVNRELCRQLASMEADGIPTGNRAVIIGFGAIGRAVGAELRRRGREVLVFDALLERRVLARSANFEVCADLETALRHGGLILGCTGRPVLESSHHALIPDGTILVSASSADVEFRGWELRRTATCLGRPGGRRDHSHPCFSLYRVNRAGRRFYLVNGGFPVNFTGEVDPIAAEKIQLTRSLLYLGALQASRTAVPGLHEFDDHKQQQLIAALDATERRAA